MANPKPPILQYAPCNPQPPWFARQSLPVICVGATLLPGLSSFLIRKQRRRRCLLLVAVILLAFLFFGPFRGLVLFTDPPHSEAGLWPFLATCIATAVYSSLLALKDRVHRLTAPRDA